MVGTNLMFAPTQDMSRIYTVLFEDQERQVEIKSVEGEYEVTLDGATHRFSPLLAKGSLYSFLIDGKEVLEADVVFRQDTCELNLQNIPYHLEVFDPRRRVVSPRCVMRMSSARKPSAHTACSASE